MVMIYDPEKIRRYSRVKAKSLALLLRLRVQQKVDVLESVTNGCGCCEQANTYYVFDGAAPEQYQHPWGPAHLFTVTEDATGEWGDICCRCCCNPYHRMSITVTETRYMKEVSAALACGGVGATVPDTSSHYTVWVKSPN